MAKYSKLFQDLSRSPCKEVSILANLISRDKRSVTGKNISLVNTIFCDGWVESPAKVKASLDEAETVEIAGEDQYNVNMNIVK